MMNKQVNPAVIAVVIVIVVIGLGFWLYHSMQPAYYIPSPGAGGRPGAGVPAYAKAPDQVAGGTSATPVVPPAGARPGDPRSLRH